MNILLVDDIESNLSVLSLLVDEWFEENEIEDNCFIAKAHNGLKALEEIQKRNYNIIFLDIMMPVMDGFEVLSQIRRLDLEVQPVVIMTTALADKNIKEEAKLLKADSYITKPINIDVIKMILDRYVCKFALESTASDGKFIEFC